MIQYLETKLTKKLKALKKKDFFDLTKDQKEHNCWNYGKVKSRSKEHYLKTYGQIRT